MQTRRCSEHSVHAEEGTAVQQELQKRHWSLKSRHAGQREKAHSPPSPSPASIHPNGPCVAQSGQEGPLLTWPRGVSRFAIHLRTSMPSFEGFPGLSRRSLQLAQTNTPHGGGSCATCGRSSLPGADSKHSCAPRPQRRKPLATRRSGARRPRTGSWRLHDRDCPSTGRGLVGREATESLTRLSLAMVRTRLPARHVTAFYRRPADTWCTSRSRSCAQQRSSCADNLMHSSKWRTLHMGHLNGLVAARPCAG